MAGGERWREVEEEVENGDARGEAVEAGHLEGPDAREEVARHDHLANQEAELEQVVVDRHPHLATREGSDVGRVRAPRAPRGWRAPLSTDTCVKTHV